MENPYLGRKVWFFTGSQDLYGPDVLLQVEEQSRQVVADLNASDELPFEIEWRPILKDRVAIHRAMVEAAREGTFREDLLFRLNVVNLKIPPLRDRPGQVVQAPLLAASPPQIFAQRPLR